MHLSEALCINTLSGIQRDLFNACQDGRSLKSLTKLLMQSPNKLSSILNKFIERNWMVKLDNKYLTLAVRMNEHIPTNVPLSILEPVTQNVYCSFLIGHFDSLLDTIDSKAFNNQNYQSVRQSMPYNKANSADAKHRAAD